VKIALVADHALGIAEGTSVVVRDLARTLPAAGAEVTLVTLNSRAPHPLTLNALRRLHADAALYVPRAGLTTASLMRAQILSTVTPALAIEILQADAEPQRIPGWLRPQLALFPSERLAAQAGAGLKSKVVPIGIDSQRFACDGDASAALWANRGGSRILHVGHIRRSRNLTVLMELAQRGANVLLVASPETDEDPDVRRALVEAGVAVHRGQVSDLAAVYRAADVYVFPVTDPRGCIETPLSVLEALSCGTHVVATAFGALREWEAPGLTLVEAEEIADVALGIAVDPAAVATSVPDAHVHAAAIVSALERLARPRGESRLVVLLGVDGAGKSTQARLLANEAEARGIDAVAVWSRWKPFILRPLMAATRRVSVRATDSRIGAYEQHISFKRRLFRLGVVRRSWEWIASLDYGVQTIPRIIAASRSAELVIADRYYQDALVDMGANYGTQPPRPRGLFRVFPRPDHVIVLDAPEEVVFSRKRDVPSVDYLRRRRPLYLELAKRHGWPVVDATQSAEDVHAEVAGIIWSTQ
jgi:thymidylate kinase/glycosyltransferase involved in cell wall biosynthesis